MAGSELSHAPDIRQQIHAGVVNLCKQSFGDGISLEIDAIMAITFPQSQQEIVVKIHQKITPEDPGDAPSITDWNTNNCSNNIVDTFDKLPQMDKPSCKSDLDELHINQDSIPGAVSMFPEMFICGDCNTEMLCKQEMIHHIRSHNNYKSIFTCLPCGEYYPNAELFGEHRLMSHDDAMSAECSICQLAFSREEMEVHELECSTERKIPTTQKNTPSNQLIQNFSRQQKKRVRNLSSKKSHMGLKNFKNLKIRSAGSRRTHIKGVPAGESVLLPKPNFYDMANRPGRIETDVQVDKDGLFPCSFCELSLLGMDAYYSHCLDVHKKYVCTYCARTFVSSRNMWRHMVFHGAKPPFRCEDCKVNYHKEDNYLRHLQMKHAYDQ